MHLLKALNDFSIVRIKRLALPDVSALQKACIRFDGAKSVPEDAQSRVVRIIASFNAQEGRLLERRDVRFVLSAVGSSQHIGAKELGDILVEVERRNDGRLVRSAFRALLAGYNEPKLRSQLRVFFAERHLNALRFDARNFCEQSGILKGDTYLENLAGELARSEEVSVFCVAKRLNKNILASSYGTELKLATVRAAIELADATRVQTCLNWALSGISGIPIGDYYEAILAPFESKSPPQNIQKILLSVLVNQFGDPRIVSWPGLKGSDGQLRRASCLAVIKRWLSIEYLDLFIKIIEDTAVDRQFKPRKAFWLEYFESDKISDVTLALASDADRVARKMRGELYDAEYMHWAKLGNASANQSVLLMQIGDLVIAEWSHSGAMRFWKADDKAAPKFHLQEYLSSALRNGSLKVKVGTRLRDSIIHHENGEWMASAANAIEYHTGMSV